MKKKILSLVILVFCFVCAQHANAVLIDFEDQSSPFNIGDNFTASGILAVVEGFEYMGGGTSTSGSLSFGSSQIAGGTGLEALPNNVNMTFLLSDSGCVDCDGVTFLFANQGGEVNLGFNGVIYKANNFSDLVGTIPGVTLNVSGNVVFILTDTPMDTFSIGGQELAVDNIFTCCIPEPATICLLGLGSLSLIGIRKKRS